MMFVLTYSSYLHRVLIPLPSAPCHGMHPMTRVLVHPLPGPLVCNPQLLAAVERRLALRGIALHRTGDTTCVLWADPTRTGTPRPLRFPAYYRPRTSQA